jgi:predicted TIM-barrel fold metal-dependent hydrolase
MRMIAVEEAFTYPPLRKAAPDSLALQRQHPLLKEVQAKLEDLGQGRLADMDSAGIDLQVISHTTPGPEAVKGTPAIELAKAANNALGAAVSAHPDRFAGLAILPMTEPGAAADELQRAIEILGFRGALVNGMTHGRFLDDPIFATVLAKAEALDVPIYLHPSAPPEPVTRAYFEGLPPMLSCHLATAAWGWHAETGLHAMRLVVSGLFDRYPRLQLIIGHMGEMIPFFLARSDMILSPLAGHLRQRVADYFRTNILITTSGIFTDPPLQCLLSVLGADRLMFAIDYPFSPNEAGRAFLEKAQLDLVDREKIAHGNAERLLRL